MASLLFTSLCAVMCVTAYAHINIYPSELEPGWAFVKMRVPHDCGDETIGTTNVTFKMPVGVVGTRLEQVEGWRGLYMKGPTGDPDYPDEIHTVTYLGFLPDYFYREFGLIIKILDTVERGTILYFPTYQECHGDGEVIAYDEIPTGDGEPLSYAAPSIVVI
mmetsp:Transcript_12968/g.32052  ORF Transcript_12968/g.32052 Transcript_12968/m.32052 type:complete len:162 (-) Transcript_12968:56-541(-)